MVLIYVCIFYWTKINVILCNYFMEKPLSHHIENSFNIFNVILQFMSLNKNRVVGKFWAKDQRPFHAKFTTKYNVLILKLKRTLTFTSIL
jgi:hypothetical protein